MIRCTSCFNLRFVYLMGIFALQFFSSVVCCWAQCAMHIKSLQNEQIIRPKFNHCNEGYGKGKGENEMTRSTTLTRATICHEIKFAEIFCAYKSSQTCSIFTTQLLCYLSQGLGALRGKINLDYDASPDPWQRHRGLYIYTPSIEMSGDYTCKISTLENEVFKTKRMTVYGKHKSFDTIYSSVFCSFKK